MPEDRVFSPEVIEPVVGHALDIVVRVREVDLGVLLGHRRNHTGDAARGDAVFRSLIRRRA